MSKKSDERIVFDEEKDARFARFLRENEYLIAHIDCLLLHKFLKLMCMGRDKSGPYAPPIFTRKDAVPLVIEAMFFGYCVYTPLLA